MYLELIRLFFKFFKCNLKKIFNENQFGKNYLIQIFLCYGEAFNSIFIKKKV